MKLIYADTLIDCFEMRGDSDLGWHLNEVIDEINDAPTVYDVDKVIEEIEAFGGCTECREKGTDKRFYYGQGCKACVFGKIVAIVKRGGADDE